MFTLRQLNALACALLSSTEGVYGSTVKDTHLVRILPLTSTKILSLLSLSYPLSLLFITLISTKSILRLLQDQVDVCQQQGVCRDYLGPQETVCVPPDRSDLNGGAPTTSILQQITKNNNTRGNLHWSLLGPFGYLHGSYSMKNIDTVSIAKIYCSLVKVISHFFMNRPFA